MSFFYFKFNIDDKQIIYVLLGKELEGSTYFHPFTKQKCPLLAASHVTTNAGTGLVHTAPAHGPEDFLVALKNKIPIVS